MSDRGVIILVGKQFAGKALCGSQQRKSASRNSAIGWLDKWWKEDRPFRGRAPETFY